MPRVKNRSNRDKNLTDVRNIAAEASQALQEVQVDQVRLEIVGDADHAALSLPLPAEAVSLLIRILSDLADGNAPTLNSAETELTTQQAADILLVSRPFLVTLLEKGEIPFRMVGSRRRILSRDLFAYKRRSEASREKAFQELADQAQDLDMGY